MKPAIAHVKNLTELSAAVEALMKRSPGVPGMGCIWGKSGYGKTTAAVWLANQIRAINLRALASWTPAAMLGTFMRELDMQPLATCSAMVMAIVERLSIERRPVMIDEADYLLSRKLLDNLRDLHDLSEQPFIFIGMHDFRRKVTHREQVAGRIAQWVEFKPADLKDARILADTVCEVEVAEDLLDELQRATGGSMRRMVIGLQRIEAAAKRTNKTKITAKEWGQKEFSLGPEE